MQYYIVCKVRADGRIIAATPPKVHSEFNAAKDEAERLIASAVDADAFMIFKGYARSERQTMPVKTTFID